MSQTAPRYHGFRATAALMQQLAKLEASYGVNGGVRTDSDGFLA
ncbi:MAG TPA: hypothetical protein VGR28_05675 [Candidatus Thermoplasmatota archaeon]|jgi:hypothetical protein|nr:hypothetical protein [Candidatus Thermoplasmatota archaeon]